jgi:hypothetical protein
VLFSAEATAIGRNPVFLAKMAFILIALANLAIYHLAARRDRLAIPPSARVHAGVSLAVWVSVLLAGRSIAYY